MVKPIKLLREVLARRAAVTGLVTFLVSTGVDLGWLGVDVSGAAAGWVNRAFILIGLLVTVLTVRPSVTPVDDPKDRNGNSLVPEPNPEDVVAVHDTTTQDDLQEAYDESTDDSEVFAEDDGPVQQKLY